MPRPKVSLEDVELEVRITPPDQKEIIDWKTEELDIVVMFQEGEPNGSPKLHYHGYIKTKRSKSWIRNWIHNITNSNGGNAVYFTRKPHDHTYGYIAKSGRCVCRVGVSQTFIDEWLIKSSDYRKQKETDRKRRSRTREDELAEIVKRVEIQLKENRIRHNADEVIQAMLDECYHFDVRFPTRTQMDHIVLKLMYPYDQYLVRLFYKKSFDLLRT